MGKGQLMLKVLRGATDANKEALFKKKKGIYAIFCIWQLSARASGFMNLSAQDIVEF